MAGGEHRARRPARLDRAQDVDDRADAGVGLRDVHSRGGVRVAHRFPDPRGERRRPGRGDRRRTGRAAGGPARAGRRPAPEAQAAAAPTASTRRWRRRDPGADRSQAGQRGGADDDGSTGVAGQGPRGRTGEAARAGGGQRRARTGHPGEERGGLRQAERRTRRGPSPRRRCARPGAGRRRASRRRRRRGRPRSRAGVPSRRSIGSGEQAAEHDGRGHRGRHGAERRLGAAARARPRYRRAARPRSLVASSARARAAGRAPTTTPAGARPGRGRARSARRRAARGRQDEEASVAGSAARPRRHQRMP